MLADVDYFVELTDGTTAILEIKTTNYNAKDNWWLDGEETIPAYYESQGRHYMAVMDAVSYTHLDVYKRQGLSSPAWLKTGPIWWEGTSPRSHPIACRRCRRVVMPGISCPACMNAAGRKKSPRDPLSCCGSAAGTST